MATLSMVITSLTKRDKTISAAHATRFLAAFRTIYGKKSNGAGGLIDRTDQELFDFIADTYFARMKEDATNIEKDAQAKTVVPIDLT